ncbi:MAG: hypothetical protein OHK0013_31050 [Sandaracinaceae bacterium]
MGASILVPAVALAIDLTSAGGFLFDIQDTGSGELSNGSIDAYDGCYYLDVGGVRYRSTGRGTTSLGGRQVEMPVASIAGLDVQRIVYVPAAMGDWARYLEVLSNPGSTPVTTTVRISGNLGSDSGTRLIATSSGGASVSATEAWFSTDDTDGSGDPSLAHLFQAGPTSGAPVSARVASLTSDNIDWTFDVTVPAGGRIAILTFAIQTTSQAAAQAEARRLLDLPDDAWTGLEEYETDIVNFPPRTILTDCTGARVGARCDDGLFCTRLDRCDAAGRCVGAGDPCDDGNACTVDTCIEAMDLCRNETTPDRCIIGGECVASGARHPAYPCLRCDPATSTRDWTAVAAGTVCGAASCSGGRLVPEATCSMTGQCLRGPTERCAAGYCADDTSCASMCADGECPGTSYCGPTGVCEIPRANASSCTTDAQCASGECVDGICCSEACTETCRSCIVPGMVGTCTDVPAMTDPDLECPGGYCDGMGACDVPDGGILLDAAMVPDAGTPDAAVVLPDAAAGLDAAVADAAVTPPVPASSCGCSAPSSNATPHAAALALLGLVLTFRRRARASR